MNPRPTGRRKACGPSDARSRLTDATAFIEIADVVDNADVKATNAIHAAIAAADAICCIELGERSVDGNHAAAARLLGSVDRAMASTLDRCLRRKTQASYDAHDISASDADACVRRAGTLVAAARERLAST